MRCASAELEKKPRVLPVALWHSCQEHTWAGLSRGSETHGAEPPAAKASLGQPTPSQLTDCEKPYMVMVCGSRVSRNI